MDAATRADAVETSFYLSGQINCAKGCSGRVGVAVSIDIDPTLDRADVRSSEDRPIIGPDIHVSVTLLNRGSRREVNVAVPSMKLDITIISLDTPTKIKILIGIQPHLSVARRYD